MLKLRLIMVLGVIVGPVLFFQSVQSYNERQAILADGIQTAALPTYIERTGGRNSEYLLNFEFIAGGETVKINRHKITSDLFDELNKAEEQNGLKPLMIKYLRNNPQSVAIINDEAVTANSKYFGLAIFIVGLLTAIHAGYEHWKVRILPKSM